MAWLTGWSYRKTISLSHAGGALTDYQVKLLVGESSGATGEDIHCGGYGSATFNDLEFTTDDGTTLLPYWIEEITGTTPNQLATVWIKTDSIGTGATTFYMYYGNATNEPINAPATHGWKKQGTSPVMVVGGAGAWDDSWVQFNTMWKDGTTYYAYYQGCKNDWKFQIGLATSTDGITWTKEGSNPIIPYGTAGEWDDDICGYPCVWKESSTWYMIYAGRKASSQIYKFGLATSADGISWTKSGSNPVYATAVTWDDGIMEPGTRMVKEGDTYYLYYWGNTIISLSSTAGIGLLTSTDLINWTPSANNPILGSTGHNTWDIIMMAPTVQKFGSTYYMFYEGCDSAGSVSQNGIATSSSKDSGWSRAATKPILPTGQGTDWDNAWTEVAVLMEVDSEWRMYYGGSRGAGETPRCQVGYATYVRTGNGDNTFPFFDDFKQRTIDTAAKWTNSGAFSLANGCATKYAANTSANYPLIGKTNIPHPCVLSTKVKVGSDWANEYSWNFNLNWDTAWATSGFLSGHYYNPTTNKWYLIKFAGGTPSHLVNGSITANVFNKLDLKINNSNQYLFVDGSQICTIAGAAPAATNPLLIATSRDGENSAFTTYFDYAYARTWVADGVEPAYGSFGGEEIKSVMNNHFFVMLLAGGGR